MKCCGIPVEEKDVARFWQTFVDKKDHIFQPAKGWARDGR